MKKQKENEMREAPYELILEGLASQHPDAKPELDFTSPYELLIATILSAQCTDKQVNKVTPALFAAYPAPCDMAKAEPEEIEPYIRSCGFYHNKAKNIVSACRDIAERFGGEVPDNREGLESLAGVGRKTANVVLSNAFGVPAIAVDTHVFRVSNRLGLASAKTVEETERQLMRNIPEDKWSIAHHWLIFHGRRVCSAQRPKCAECMVRELCREYSNRKDKEDK
ncbi:MAG: endonuclease III [Clostridia bacterium]|nr:endonuclease III [Clostridia bacterium]MBR3487395.1 endonuclease III [Clostridia bacterium]